MARLIGLTVRTMLIAFFSTMLVGCGERTPEPTVPDKPPLSAEKAKQSTEQMQRVLVKSLEQQSKSLNKK